MAKPQFPIGRETTPRMPDIRMEKFAEARVNGGMITTIDPADIPLGALQYILNARVRFDKTSRRPGGALFEPLKPDSNPVLKFASLKTEAGVPYTLRFTPTTVHKIDGTGAWALLTGTLAGDQYDRFNTAVVFNKLIFSNNGEDYIQVVDPTFTSYDRLGNAPKYRYICGFYNRVIGFALRDTNEVEIGWSAEAGITGVGLEEWDPMVDETAGSTPLVESPADLSDFITGGFSWTNVMLVLREKSVWIGTKQPIPQNPFDFKCVIPGIGCDCPYSAANIGDGLAWFDTRTATAYAYAVGGGLEPIGRNIEKDIARSIVDRELVFSSYDPVPNEYSIFVQDPTASVVTAWTYNRRGKTWAKNEYELLTSVDDIESGYGSKTIDQLVGTMEALIPTYDNLSPSSGVFHTRLSGYFTGEAAIEDVNVDQDVNSVEYETVLVSKTFTIPEDDIYIAEIRIEYRATIGGSFRIEYSRSGEVEGAIGDAWIFAKTINMTTIAKRRIAKFKKMIRCRAFAFRLVSEDGLFDILSYEVHVYKAGLSVK